MDKEIKKTHYNLNDSNLKVKQLRYRLFRLQSNNYEWNDNLKEQIEKLENFDGWNNFNITWDVYWFGWKVWQTTNNDGKNVINKRWIPHFFGTSRVLHIPVKLIKKNDSGHVVESEEEIYNRITMIGPNGEKPIITNNYFNEKPNDKEETGTVGENINN